MRVLFVGAGATGGFYGGKLIEAGRDVTFLVREHRAQQISERGLEIVDLAGSMTLHPNVVTADLLRRSGQTFDLIVISTKAYQLEQAMDDVAAAVGPETMLLPILNGMRQLTALDARFGPQHVLGGSVRVVSDLDAEGRIHVLATLDQMSYGERSRERTARIEAVDAVMQGAGFRAILEPDITAALWDKWWVLASMGVACILARGAAGQFAAAPRGLDFLHAVVKECTDIATANGYPPKDDALREHLERITAPGSVLTSSLYRDMMKGAPVEADHILGDLLDHANGVAAPLLTAAFVQLKVYEAGRT